MTNQIEEFVRLMDENKSTDITVLDMQGLTYVADYFIIATVMNKPHADMISRKLEELNFKLTGDSYFRIEGKQEGEWVLIDAGDIIIHLFQKDMRTYYNLDALWGDAPRVDVSDWLIE
ncbi:MAG: ribosome silencing factor [Peptococcaceae bacterium]|nr:ribosome silencing factor [Peptococcaceae bacterium]